MAYERDLRVLFWEAFDLDGHFILNKHFYLAAHFLILQRIIDVKSSTRIYFSAHKYQLL